MVDIQAQARVHRIGQTKPVHVYRLVSGGTAEERIIQRAQKKLYLDQMVNRGSTANADALEGFSKTDLLSMLRFGAETIFTSGHRMPSDEEIDRIISRTVSDPEGAPISSTDDASNSRFQSGVQTVSAFDVSQPLPPCSMLYGEDFSKIPETLGDIGDEWRNMVVESKKRVRKSTFEMVDSEIGQVAVLNRNNYSLTQGEPSVYLREQKSTVAEHDLMLRLANARKRKKLGDLVTVLNMSKEAIVERTRALVRAGKLRGSVEVQGAKAEYVPDDSRPFTHDNYCLICWDGGDLVCCDYCPSVYHVACLAELDFEVPSKLFDRFTCPHHCCMTCMRKSGAVGMLFRCSACINCYCEDHKPPSSRIVGANARYDDLNYSMPSGVCYIHCSADCDAWALEQLGVVDPDQEPEIEYLPLNLPNSTLSSSDPPAGTQIKPEQETVLEEEDDKADTSKRFSSLFLELKRVVSVPEETGSDLGSVRSDVIKVLATENATEDVGIIVLRKSKSGKELSLIRDYGHTPLVIQSALEEMEAEGLVRKRRDSAVGIYFTPLPKLTPELQKIQHAMLADEIVKDAKLVEGIAGALLLGGGGRSVWVSSSGTFDGMLTMCDRPAYCTRLGHFCRLLRNVGKGATSMPGVVLDRLRDAGVVQYEKNGEVVAGRVSIQRVEGSPIKVDGIRVVAEDALEKATKIFKSNHIRLTSKVEAIMLRTLSQVEHPLSLEYLKNVLVTTPKVAAQVNDCQLSLEDVLEELVRAAKVVKEGTGYMKVIQQEEPVEDLDVICLSGAAPHVPQPQQPSQTLAPPPPPVIEIDSDDGGKS
eukprot:c14042_g1_i1.p1 GENE.c14042_g1_i1~~c14042_g1_i1.p1  ORF type:complete len:836 (+),score=201.14 c14042_g1_i1:65-2509(+)